MFCSVLCIDGTLWLTLTFYLQRWTPVRLFRVSLWWKTFMWIQVRVLRTRRMTESQFERAWTICWRMVINSLQPSTAIVWTTFVKSAEWSVAWRSCTTCRAIRSCWCWTCRSPATPRCRLCSTSWCPRLSIQAETPATGWTPRGRCFANWLTVPSPRRWRRIRPIWMNSTNWSMQTKTVTM